MMTSDHMRCEAIGKITRLPFVVWWNEAASAELRNEADEFCEAIKRGDLIATPLLDIAIAEYLASQERRRELMEKEGVSPYEVELSELLFDMKGSYDDPIEPFQYSDHVHYIIEKVWQPGMTYQQWAVAVRAALPLDQRKPWPFNGRAEDADR